MDGTRAFIDRLIAWSPVLLLGGLAALTYWLDAQVQPSTAHRDGSARHDPDLFLINFRATNFDPEGKPRETLTAVRGDHFPDDDSAELTQPTFQMTQTGKPTFTVNADRGKVTGDRENVYFTGTVRARRDAEDASSTAPGHQAAGPMTLETEYLHVIPKTEQAETDRRVTIHEPRGIIEAVGLDLDNKSKTAKLRSRVSGTFEPQTLKK
jgi:lipopolysaccharide export system protein LptC